MESIYDIESLNHFLVSNVNNVILLYFGAKWCGPCKKLKERLNETETKELMPKLAVGYIDIDDEANSNIMSKYNISMLPTQVFIKVTNNKVHEVSRVEGYDFTKLVMEYNNYRIF